MSKQEFMTREQHLFLFFIERCLDDENGISQEAYDCFLDIVENAGSNIHCGFTNRLLELRASVDATDGRFYLRGSTLSQ